MVDMGYGLTIEEVRSVAYRILGENTLSKMAKLGMTGTTVLASKSHDKKT